MKHRNIKNFIVGLLSQVIILIFGFVVPRIILTHYGSDTNGLMNTITQIFTYMALLEAGISNASRNALYKHIINDDKQEISVIMSASRRYYRKISYIYLAAVIILAVVVPFILRTEIDYWTIFFFVLFEGLTSVVAFYFINTWTCLLTASGKSYITNALTLLNKVLCYGVRIVLALYTINIAFIQVGYFAVSLIQLGIYYVYMHKKYSWIDYNAAPKEYKLADRNSYILSEIAWTVFSSTDLIILSIFVSTSLSSVYSTYNMIFVALNGLLNSVYSALYYNLGQTYHTDINRYKRLHDQFNSIFVGGMTAMLCVAYWLTLPFVSLYTEGVTDINYMYHWLPLMFCLTQLLAWSRYISGNLANVAGYAKPVSRYSIVEAAINLIGSIILVQFFDIMGVLIATVVALPARLIYTNYIADIKVMKRKPWKTISILGVNYAIFAATVLIKELVADIVVENYWQFIVAGLVLAVGYSIVVIVLNVLVNRDLLSLFKKVLRRKSA